MKKTSADLTLPAFTLRPGRLLRCIQGKRHFNPHWNGKPPELLWRRALGKARSSFVFQENKAITRQRNGNDEEVICLDLATGEDVRTCADKRIRFLLVRNDKEAARYLLFAAN